MLKVFRIFCCLTIGLMLFSGIGMAASSDAVRIVINIPSRTLTFYKNMVAVKEYPVGVGRSDSPTPLGMFRIFFKELNPIWRNPIAADEAARVIEPSPRNPLGYRWMEFAALYGIHGTNDPDSIGHYVSNGCIRMQESDVEELYPQVPLGTSVEVSYERLCLRKTVDNKVTLFLYPDEYGIQPLSMVAVRQQLVVYGVAKFVTDGWIAAALSSADGAVVQLPGS